MLRRSTTSQVIAEFRLNRGEMLVFEHGGTLFTRKRVRFAPVLDVISKLEPTRATINTASGKITAHPSAKRDVRDEIPYPDG